jgi:pimeloyl-ACP methyl ester carboxylesterase
MMQRLIGAFELLAAFAVVPACAHGPDARSPRVPTVTVSRMIPIGHAVKLEVVDWGGRGQPLVFLAGLGNTAHVFDAFAPQFTDHFHAVGITRRGFGASAGAPPPDNLDTLVADVATALDSLGLGRVVLVGHSIAGEEMTRFAELHGARCAGLVYLDAAYDRSGMDTLASRQPSAPAPGISAADTASFASLRALYARVMGVEEPESDIRATERFDAADRYLGSVTPNSLKVRVASGRQVAQYDRSHCRALAVYAIADSVADVVPYYKELDAAQRAQAESLFRFVQGVVADSRARIGRLPQFQVVDVHRSNHYVFLHHPREVAEAMRTFLASESASPRPDDR